MLILVRHASPHLPTLGGPDDFHRGLTARGHAEAAALAERLAELAPVRVLSSPYLRAAQTVRPLADVLGLAVETDDDLREWDSGVGPRPDFARLFAESWADPEHARPGAESLTDVSARAVAALAELSGTGAGTGAGTVVVGSHGTFAARALVGLGLAGIDFEFWRRMPMPAVYRVRVEADGVVASGPGLSGPDPAGGASGR